MNNNSIPINSFKELNCSQLQGCVAAKNAKNLKELKACFSKLSLKKWPNEGTLDGAKNEVPNLARLAHESRNRKNVAALPLCQDLLPDEACHALPCPIAKSVRMSQRSAEAIRIEVESRVFSAPWREDA